ncbi:MAG TPA: hypothetical protein DCR31_07470 [Ruminococcaceae bacterium]|nr:hypothetical protein [Oscillospiraceae bacterium]
MQKARKKWSCIALAVSLAVLPMRAAAEEPTALQNDLDTPSKGIIYQSAFDLETSAGDRMQELFCFVQDSGFNRIYFDPSGQAEKALPQLPAIRIRPNEEKALEELSALTELLEENEISLSLVFDPFSLSPSHPAYQFVKTAVNYGSDIAAWEGENLRLDPSQERNLALAQWNLQKLLAAGSMTDEILFPSTAFLSEHQEQNSQIAQAQRMAAFLEGISGGGLSVSVRYDPLFAPTAQNGKRLATPELTPQTLVENQLADAIYPVADEQTADCEEKAECWNNWAEGLEVVPYLQNSSDDHYFSICSQIFLLRQSGISSVAVAGYEQRNRSSESAALLSFALLEESSLIPEGYSLQVPQTFAITKPDSDITISASSYYVMGTSNPNLPLYFDGELVERQTANGGFGVYLTDIPVGTSTYTFSQGAQSKTISITRTDPTQTSVSYLSKIVQSSMYPYYDEAVKVGEPISFGCTAPAGARVSATFQGKTVVLTQKAAAQSGVPASYSGTMLMPDAEDDNSTTKIGAVTYTLTYQGITTSYTSSGELYVVGKNTTLAVMANDYINNVYGNVAIADDFYMTLYQGACDYVDEVTDSHYKLRSGGYLPKSTADILEGAPIVENKVSAASFKVEERGESLTLTGTAKAPYKAYMTDTKLVVTLWNTNGVPENTSPKNSSLFQEISSVKNDDGSVTLTFSYQEGVKLWGYSVEYDGENTVIFAKKAPVLAESHEKPLEGIVVVIDAGHGGEDPGALGIAGTSGPTEKDLNFISAYASKQILEALGASVHMVSEDNARLTFEERMDPARNLRADFFLSFHHNSTEESFDSSNSFGTEIYYHEQQSKMFAENILDSITSANGRIPRGAYQDYYRVTRMTYAPSLLLELGFVVNPAEYEDLCQPIRIYQTALGVADGIMRTVENFGSR